MWPFGPSWGQILKRFAELCDAEGIGPNDAVPERLMLAAGFRRKDILQATRDIWQKRIALGWFGDA